MMETKKILVLGLYLTTIIPNLSTALEVDINGISMHPGIEGNPCIDITGEYPGFKIVPSEVGKIPQICFDNLGQNNLEIHHATFESTRGPQKDDQKGAASNDVTIRFSHEFPPGPNGMVTARAQLNGFFSTSTGVGAPVGNRITLKGYFSQDGNYDIIAEPFMHTVDDTIESGVFQFGAKKQYLVSGRRLLRGELNFSFARFGDKLTLPLATGVTVDLGSQFEDRLDALESEQTEAAP